MCSVVVLERTATARSMLFLKAQNTSRASCEATSAEKGQVVRNYPLLREIGRFSLLLHLTQKNHLNHFQIQKSLIILQGFDILRGLPRVKLEPATSRFRNDSLYIQLSDYWERNFTVEIEGNTNRPLYSSETSLVQDASKSIAELYFSE